MPVSSVHWLEGPAIAVLCQKGAQAHLKLFSADGQARLADLHHANQSLYACIAALQHGLNVLTDIKISIASRKVIVILEE